MSYESYRPNKTGFLPDVVKNLLIINVIMYVATILLQSQGLDLIDKLGLHYLASEKFGVWQFITYMFMHDIGTPGHISIAHIGMNMFILFMFGPMVENMWGAKKFLTYYILTGIGAALTHYAILYFQIHPDIVFLTDYINASSQSEMNSILSAGGGNHSYTKQFIETIAENHLSPTESIDLASQFLTQILNAPVIIGASGAIFGILLAYGMLFPNSILYVFLAIPMKAKYAVILFGVLELYMGIAGGDNVAHFAHLGGLFTGLIIIYFWRYQSRQNRNDFFNRE